MFNAIKMMGSITLNFPISDGKGISFLNYLGH